MFDVVNATTRQHSSPEKIPGPKTRKRKSMEDWATRTKRVGWLHSKECSLADFRAEVEQETDHSAFPLAKAVVCNALVYDRADLPIGDAEGRARITTEWMQALSDGPGVICIQGAFTAESLPTVDAATEAFQAIIKKEKEVDAHKGDHFGKPGENSRIWNALEKMAVSSPETFVEYYSNPIIALAARAWLGANYQVTSQVNIVHPGGTAQSAHRDYHLGFQTNESCEEYPAHVHDLTSKLTLQGAVAHCDMPLKAGPTLYMPHSQKYELGYLAWRQDEFKEYFAKHHVQLPLRKGDAIFFNPALFHAAGNNASKDIHRCANLLQISSAFGRMMETVDRVRVSLAVYPALLEASAKPDWTPDMIQNAIAASAEGYSFPTNLDLDQPLKGSAPETQAQLIARTLAERWSFERVEKEVLAQARRWRSV